MNEILCLGLICQSFYTFYKAVYAVAFSLDNDLRRAMDQSVHRRTAHEGVGKYHNPLVEVPVARNNRGGSFVALADDLVEV